MEKKRVDEHIWEIPPDQKPGMIVPARILASEELVASMDEGVFNQITNVACLPGIRRYAWCMPDGHWGYGFPIGGVAAFDIDEGVISPGGIGFDINCGVRMIKTDVTADEIKPKIKTIVEELFRQVPAGIGRSGFVKLSKGEFEKVMSDGALWCLKNGYAWESDIDRIEQGGRLEHADPSAISEKAFKRGITQIGTLGSGNHYLEVQAVTFDHECDVETARALGINREGQIVVMIHCGSRGFGHQVATDYLQTFGAAMRKYGITTNDRELACAPITSPEGKSYFAAMACAANSAFANRQVITHGVRKSFESVFGKSATEMGMELVYDVTHNIAKIETYEIDGKPTKLLVHRKGATRAFGPGNANLAERFKATGQPVLVGGSMQTGSYLLVGTRKAEDLTFGSTIHGAGRVMSRAAARKKIRGSELLKEMEKQGIYVQTVSFSGLAEEAGFAYKNVSAVTDVVHTAGISRKIARLLPLANIKG